MNNKKVVLGMSGGVDSSVAAYLLKKSGYEVIGVYMKMWHKETYAQQINTNNEKTAIADAKKVADFLDIEFYVLDVKDEFKKCVVNNFIDQYLQGKTPNPCVECNRYIKWEALMKKGEELGAGYIATGHYAQVVSPDDVSGRFKLKKSKTAAKDQTYVLYNFTQEQLSKTIMPLGEYSKDEIREIAGKIGLEVANKPDSQEICFIEDDDYVGFIKDETGSKLSEGDFVSTSGEVLGRHKGIINYTIGQRKGLGIAFGHPMFVTQIRPETNQVVLGEADDVWGSYLKASKLNWIGIEGIADKPVNAIAKIRYAHAGERCIIENNGEDSIIVKFERPVRAITPGQSVVFYDDEDFVIGGGEII